ncbi:MAG TPA: ABC transporter ATP-binding protein [Methylomusa anaerophila]|uniref:Putative multidrug export ATP-binding/permease protein n=1 Tax=Methylomusa anaerophila TaxID=1930071 RepID=A0A348ALA2_9FIRM|nr:ABC transporter ATP-binding protein [Methylomusa anaerophila]BBB91850.1 putative multidrug export ATP-binding/permease protein [Methylomusa anaerophila]HML88417.1 ABC transporter ATP-binding protein [Methylomusa anaerophila]
MKKIKKNHWLKTVFSFAAECREKMLGSVLCAIISVIGGLVPYIGVYQIIILFFDGRQTAGALWFWATVCLVGHVIKIGFYALSTMLAHYSAYSILENMRIRMAGRLMKAPLGTVLNQPAGKLKNVIIDRAESIEVPLAHLIPEGISNLLLPVGVFFYLVLIDWRMALAAMLTIPVAVTAYAIMMRTFNRQYADYTEASNHVNSVIVEYIEGIEVVKAFNQSAASYEKFERAVQSFKEYTLNWFRSTWKLMNFGGSVLPSTLLGTMPAGMLLYLNGPLSPADLTMCLILSLGIVAPLTSFTVFVNDAKSVEYAVNDAVELLTLEELPAPDRPAKLNGFDIELDHVSFAYDTARTSPADNAGSNVLHDINLKLPQGSFTALVGPSGGGKSTVARLIARFWDAGSGEIRIGGVAIRNLPLTQLADTISFVTQDNFLFNCSLRENIRLGNPAASDSEVLAAARAACCDEFIRRLDGGYDTGAGEAGSKLSGGEKQRIAIARALLKNAPVVILDEATAFTDPENEDKLQTSIAALTNGKTLLVIAHRLSTIKQADQIVVMDKGRIAATGKHDELLAGCKLYRAMWDAHIGTKNWAANQAYRETTEVKRCV